MGQSLSSAHSLKHLDMHSTLAVLTGRDTITATPDTPLQTTLHAMVEHQVGSIVIVAADCKPVGIFTLRDVLVRVATRSHQQALAIGDVMSHQNLVVLPRSATLYQAALCMARQGLRHIIIVDDAGRLAGIVSQNDIYRSVNCSAAFAGLLELPQA
jgi:CBS domain-containing protein